MTVSERQEGYYWIETSNGWEPAVFQGGAFWICGMSMPWPEEDIEQVGEKMNAPGVEAFRAGDD